MTYPLEEPCELDTGDTAFMLLSTAMVALQVLSIGITQVGLIRRKNSLAMLMQALTGFTIITVVYMIYGYTLSFGPTAGGVIGDFSFAFFSRMPACVSYAPNIPHLLFAFFQMTFAVLTPTLVSGAWSEKITFPGFCAFCVAWPTLVYFPVSHWIWGGGFLQKWGVMDFAGGLVVHTTAGVASLTVALILQKRAKEVAEASSLSNIPMTFVGGSLTLVAWYFFNGGSALTADSVAVTAALNTHIGSCTSALVWLLIAYFRDSFFHLTELLFGALAGMACITPASGFISTPGAFVLGIFGGVVSYFTVYFVRERLDVDDVLDVFSLQAAPGLTGAIIGIGFMASPFVNDAAPSPGIVHNGGGIIWKQLAAGVLVVSWTAFATWLIFFFFRLIGFKYEHTLEEIAVGVDKLQHGMEISYGGDLEELLEGKEDAVSMLMCKAAKEGDLNSIRRWIKTGANPRAADYDGRTIAHLAAAEGHVHLLEYIFEHIPGGEMLFNQADRFGTTCLADARRHGHEETVAWLVKHGAKLEVEGTGKELCDAAAANDVGTLRELARLGVNLSLGDYDNRTALHLAAAHGHVEAVEFLLENGADPSVRDRWGGLARDDARRGKHQAVVTLLEDAAHDLAEKMCRASARGNLEEIKRLARNGCDINLGDYDGRTALHLACAAGHREIVEFLIECNANVNKQDNMGGFPLEDARRHGHQEIVEIMVQAGALDHDTIRVSDNEGILNPNSILVSPEDAALALQEVERKNQEIALAIALQQSTHHSHAPAATEAIGNLSVAKHGFGEMPVDPRFLHQ